MLQILEDTGEDEVEFAKTGSWKPVEKSKPLTLGLSTVVKTLCHIP